MNTPRWERAKEIFDAALDLKPEARSSYVLQSCSDDVELRREVEDLLAADAEAGSFMNPGWLAPFSPFKPEPEFELAPGDVVSGRFKIVRPLGDGGMGRVYEAHDSVLGVQVALKTLRPEISANPEVLFRFRQEVRIAHRITHPNVCRTYHLDHEIRQTGADESSSVDLTFLTMEFLEGETLQQLLKRSGRLLPARALAVARQMAEAIEAAHQIGIVHRDIKPSNVMICATSASEEAARVVMTDFGLAKFEAAAPNNDVTSISQPGRAMGTLSYMSPEQLKGGEVSCLTDIYAFGLVLYEMVTGVKAFPDSSTMETAYRRTVEPPPSPRTVLPELPREWETAVLGCLQIEPVNRFQHAMDAVDILEGSAPYSSRLRLLQRPTVVQRKRLRRRMALMGAAFAVGVALSAIGLRYFMARGDSAVAAGALVYLAPVKNETGEKQLDNVTELVKAGLEQSAQINLLDAGRVGDILQQMTRPPDAAIDETTAREIAMRAGAARVVFATLSGATGNYRMDVEIQRPDTNNIARYRNHWLRTFSWQMAATSSSESIAPELLSAIQDTNSWIRLTAGESRNDIERLGIPPEDITTDNWAALSAYTSAEHFYDARKFENAIAELQRAVQLDTHFALAYARMGDLSTALGRIEEGYRDYERALSTDFDRRLTRRELDRIRGEYACDSWDYQTAETTFRDYTLFYENDYMGWFYRALPLAKLNRFAEANAVLQRAYAIDPHKPNAPHDLAIFAVQTNDMPGAAHWIDVLQSQHHRDGVDHMRGILAVVDGRFADAQKDFLEMSASAAPAYRLRGFAFLTRLATETADPVAALKWAEAGAREATVQGNIPRQARFLLDSAQIHSIQRQFDLSRRESQAALALDQSPPTVIAVAQMYGDMLSNDPKSSAAIHGQLLTMAAHTQAQAEANPGRLAAQVAASIVRVEWLIADAQWAAALAEARHASTIDSQYIRQPSFSRALRAAASHTLDRDSQRALLSEERAILARTATHPNVLWSAPEADPPGALADDLQQFIEVSNQLHRNDESVLQAAHQLHTLRASPSFHLSKP